MKPPVPFNVYLQALGGKFLGPHAYDNTTIQLSLQYSMGYVDIPYTVIPNTTDDGGIGTVFTNGVTSFLPILTMPLSGTGNPAVNYLTPDSNTIRGTTNIFLPNTNETALLTASIPTPSGTPFILSQNVLLNPQQVDYTITMVVPGLLLTPNTSTTVPPGTISVFVAMMCGCKITVNNPTSFWTYTDFNVSARILYKDGTSKQVDLAFDTTVNLSLFTATVEDINNIQQVNFAAQQKSTGNYSVLLQDY